MNKNHSVPLISHMYPAWDIEADTKMSFDAFEILTASSAVRKLVCFKFEIFRVACRIVRRRKVGSIGVIKPSNS